MLEAISAAVRRLLRPAWRAVRDKYLLVNPLWYAKLRWKNAFSKKIRVGFGPIVTNERTLGNRKWHIDPIVDSINANSETYVADVFFAHDDYAKFDIAVLVRHFQQTHRDSARRAAQEQRILIYRALDTDCRAAVAHFADIGGDVSGYIICSPLQQADLPADGRPATLIESPVINTKRKTVYRAQQPVTLVWQGFAENMETMRRLDGLVADLAATVRPDIRLLYHANMPSRDTGLIRYVRWRIEDWEQVLVDADIGIVIKPVDDAYQQRKPATKVISYMAAGLPVVCTPSEADRAVITHGVTGFFAHTDEDWRKYLTLLIEDAALRQEIGMAARAYVSRHFAVDRIAAKYTAFFDEIAAWQADPVGADKAGGPAAHGNDAARRPSSIAAGRTAS